MRLVIFVEIVLLLETCSLVYTIDEQNSGASNNHSLIPIIMVTWDYENATQRAWDVIYNQKKSALDAIEEGCSLCEEQQCRKTVGFGGSPDELGETTLDALIMDGTEMDVGAVGELRNVKRAISVARKVLEHTYHSFLVGDRATDFAVNMGFKKESLQTNESKQMWLNWKDMNCQPNFWKNVVPNPKHNCGPYHPHKGNMGYNEYAIVGSEENHDTIGIIAIDSMTRIAAGTSTNGANHKIPGRIGDSPIVGAGAYADQDVGAAACTGDGDIMMRFLPSFLVVEEMRRGVAPDIAARTAIDRITKYYPNFFGAVIALNKKGEYGASCNGMKSFPYYIANPSTPPMLNVAQCNRYKVVVV